MSAPLVLSSADLRNLAYALDALGDIRRKYGVEPPMYNPEISLTTGDGDTVSLSVEEREGVFVINERVGS